MAKKRKKKIKPEVYTDSITFECPVRGEVTQIVKVKRYPAAAYAAVSDVEIELVAELLDSTDSILD